MQTLKFNYYDEFACTGPECEDTCCQHWNIFLTKREYLDFKKMGCSPELRTRLDSSFKRIRSENENHYAKVEFSENGMCPLLGEDRLCMLQKEKGESALTLVCSVFPRNWSKIGSDVIAFTLTPTCYHVVELLMQHPEGLVLSEGEYDGKNKWINQARYAGKIIDPDSKILPYIWTIKTAQLDILQNRSFTISERLLILGYYTNKLREYLKNSPEKITSLSSMMLDNELTAKIAESLKAPQDDVQAAMKTSDMLFKLIRFQQSTSPEAHSAELLRTVADGIGLTYLHNADGQIDVHWDLEAYINNCDIFRRIEADRPYIIENLLVTLCFSQFSDEDKLIWADYFALVALYNVIKAGVAAFLPENYTDKDLAMALTNIVKMLINTNLTAFTLTDFARHGTDTLPYIAFLVS